MDMRHLISILLLSLMPLISSRPLNSPLLASYDYIVVGGGPGGLTIANRLSEDPNITVLVLEAGPAFVPLSNPPIPKLISLNKNSSDHSEPSIQIPVKDGQNIYSRYDWNLYTAPQTYLDGKARYYPLGRGLGGGTLINGMLWNRGGQGDYDDWEKLGNPGWGWDSMLPYFKKSETYTPVTNGSIADVYSIFYDPEVHGFSGPVNVSYQRYFYTPSINLFKALRRLGIPIAYEPQNGLVAGASYLPFDLDPINQTRADARRSYYEPYSDRPNLYVSTLYHVTQLIFEDLGCVNNNSPPALSVKNGPTQTPTGNNMFGFVPPEGLGSHKQMEKSSQFRKRNTMDSDSSGPDERRKIIGVEFAENASSPRQSISAKREVILCAGAVHTPQILELSGIGSSSILEAHSITQVIDLPGVGNNMQDHFLVGTLYPFRNKSYIYSSEIRTNATFNMLAKQEYYANRTGPWTAGPPDGVAFPSLPDISPRSAGIIAAAKNQTFDTYLASGLDPTVIAGYKQQRLFLLAALASRNRAAYELLNNNAGGLTVSNMRPFGRGATHIRSSSPFDSPTINPRYGSDPTDLEILREALKFNRRLLATYPMTLLDAFQFLPRADANDTQLMQFIKRNMQTEYHPSCTCAMLPRELGGVVDPNLLVYGTSNLRIVDASIFPLVPAAHLQAVVYGVAEKAADIIRAAQASASVPAPSQSPTCVPNKE